LKSEAEKPKPYDFRERSFEFAIRTVTLCRKLANQSGVSRTLAKQLLRSGTSIGADIEEAHGSHSKRDFTAKMYIACKEARETHYWTRLLLKTDISSENLL
jgi:four helix bundle protein